MAYDEGVAQRIRNAFTDKPGVTEKKMFGGIAFMLGGNMCCGVIGDELMARVGPDQHEAALAHPHARVMDFTGRPMKGYVYVASQGFASEKELRKWVEMCVRFVDTLPRK